MENQTDNFTDWENPQRQSVAAIIILWVKTAVELLKGLWPFLVLYLFRDKKEGEGITALMIFIAIILFICVLTLINYWFYKFHIKHNNLVINSGWLKKKTVTIPLQNIQAVHLEQNLWQRVLNVVKLSIDSAGSEKLEAEIDALSIKKAEQLKAILLSQTAIESEPDIEKRTYNNITKLTHADLLKLSLTSNHLEAFLILIGLSLNLIDNLKDAFRVNSWKIMESYAVQMAAQTTIVISILIFVVAFTSIVVSIIRTTLKFYNFSLQEIAQGWKISFGLLKHQENIIPSNKIQILSWRSNWLRRKIDFWIIHVQSIGHLQPGRKHRIQIPVTSLSRVFSLAPIYQTSPVFNIPDGLRIEPDYWKRKTLFVGVPVTLLLVVVFYLWAGFAGLGATLLIGYFTWYFNKWFNTFRWFINDEGLQLYSGVWGRKFSLLTWKKIQQVQLTQTPYQRLHELASVNFITAGGNVKLPYIKLNDANNLVNLAMYYVESRDENWM